MFKLFKFTPVPSTYTKSPNEVSAMKVKLFNVTSFDETVIPILFNTALSPVMVTGLVNIT